MPCLGVKFILGSKDISASTNQPYTKRCKIIILKNGTGSLFRSALYQSNQRPY